MVTMYTSLLLFWERGTFTFVTFVSFGRTAVVTGFTVSAIDADFHVFSTLKLHHIISIVMRAIPKLPLREKIMCYNATNTFMFGIQTDLQGKVFYKKSI